MRDKKKRAPTKAQACAAARAVERLAISMRPYFQRYHDSLTKTELDEYGYQVQELIDLLSTLENQSGNVTVVLK